MKFLMMCIVNNIGKIEGFVKKQGENLKEILKNGIHEGKSVRCGYKKCCNWCLKHVFDELSVKYVDFYECIHKI